jgi:hypothetical protein
LFSLEKSSPESGIVRLPMAMGAVRQTLRVVDPYLLLR